MTTVVAAVQARNVFVVVPRAWGGVRVLSYHDYAIACGAPGATGMPPLPANIPTHCACPPYVPAALEELFNGMGVLPCLCPPLQPRDALV
jgi:hypothetical protein